MSSCCYTTRYPGFWAVAIGLGLTAPPALSEPTISLPLTQLWTTDEEIVLGWVRDLAVIEDRVYVLDSKQESILILDPETGAATGTLGRVGEGPGEYRRPVSVFAALDEGVGVADMRARDHVILYGSDGTYRREVELARVSASPSESLSRLVPSGDRYIAQIHARTSERESLFVVAYRPDGSLERRFAALDLGFDRVSFVVNETFFGQALRWDARGGCVAISDRYEEPRVDVWRAGALTTASIPEITAAPRTREEKAEIRYGLSYNGREAKVVLRDTWRAIGNVKVVSGDEIWIIPQHVSQHRDDGLVVYRYDGSLRPRGRSVLTGAPLDRRDTLFVIDGRVFVFWRDLDDEMERDVLPLSISCYSLGDG